MKNKSILNIAIIGGCIVSQTNAIPLTDDEIKLLAEESCFKVRQLEDSLHRVHSLSEREELLSRMIGYVLIADLTKATNANEVLTASYMAPFIPIDQTREFFENGRTIGKIDLNQLCYMLKPSKEMIHILQENVETRRRNAGEQAAYRAALTEYVPTMGFLAQIFLAIRNEGAVVPAFPAGVQGIAYPVSAELSPPEEGFFQKWWQNIRERFVETEGERLIASMLRLILQIKGGDDVKESVRLIKEDIEQKKNGVFSLSLDLLAKNYPDWGELIQALREALQDQMSM
jgi:hypothetical protein